MAGIQYRPIDAPDFSSAMRALQMSGGFLDNAFNSAQNTLGMLRNQQTQSADQEVLMRALRQQSADGLSGALADGSLLQGVNPNRLSAGVLTGLQDQVGTRLNQDRTRQMLETGALGLEEGRYNFGRTQDVNQRSDAARGAINAIAEASQRGDTAGVQRLRAQYADVLGNLNGDQALALAKDSQGLVRGELQQRTGEFGLSRDQYNLGIDQRDDREGRAANVLANQVLRMAAGGEDARAVLESMEGVDPNVRAAATRLVQSAFPGTYGPLGSGAAAAGPSAGVSGSAPGTAGTRQGSAYDTTFEFQATPRPITQMAIGDVIDHQSSMISRQGHSPLGAFQINKATLEDFGPRVLGKDWKTQNFTPENQDKIGEAIFNARKNGNLKGTWAALPDSTPGAYKDLSWQEMRQRISQAEVGQAVGRSGNQQLQTGSSAAEVLTRAMQNNATGIGNDFAESIQDNRDAGQVVDSLIGEGGSFAGANRGDVLREINRVASQANVNPATAAAVLRRNITNSPGTAMEYLQYAANRLGSPIRSSPNLGNGLRLNDDGVDATIESLRNGSEFTNFQRNQETGAVLQRIESAQSTYNDAVSQLTAMTQRAATQPGLRAQLPRYQQRVQLAQASLEAAREAQRALPQLRPEFQRTAPEPVAESRGGTSARTTEILREAAAANLPSGIPAAGYRGQGRNW
ncbi:structural protein [Xanthomonas virus PB119]|nr:structural protein [Xanthomonas virus PB119]